jgi:hypothetical protein
MDIDQHDPYLKVLRRSSKSINIILIIVLLLSIVSLGFGIKDITFPDDVLHKGIYLVNMGILLAIVYFIGLVQRARKEERQSAIDQWEYKTRQRKIAAQHPDQFLAREQPQLRDELPQPTRASIGLNPILDFFFQWCIYAAIWAPLQNLQQPDAWKHPLKLTLMSIISGLAINFLRTGLSLLMTKTPVIANLHSIQLTENTIQTRFNNLAKTLKWQDIRMIATYTLESAPDVQIYDLVSVQTIIRWQWQHTITQRSQPWPRMSQQAYDNWKQQVVNYICTRTHLPLIDLDQKPETDK